MEEEKKKETTEKVEEKDFKKLKENLDKEIEKITQEGVKRENTDYLYRLVDIRKDLGEIEKEEMNMRYSEYGEGSMSGYGYGEGSFGRRGVPGTGRGRYSEGGSFGRRGVKGTGRGRYRGEEMMDEMMYHYGNYSEGGQYGGEEETLRSLDYMMKSVVQFIEMLEEEAQSPQEIEIIKKYSKKISEM